MQGVRVHAGSACACTGVQCARCMRTCNVCVCAQSACVHHVCSARLQRVRAVRVLGTACSMHTMHVREQRVQHVYTQQQLCKVCTLALGKELPGGAPAPFPPPHPPARARTISHAAHISTGKCWKFAVLANAVSLLAVLQQASCWAPGGSPRVASPLQSPRSNRRDPAALGSGHMSRVQLLGRKKRFQR